MSLFLNVGPKGQQNFVYFQDCGQHCHLVRSGRVPSPGGHLLPACPRAGLAGGCTSAPRVASRRQRAGRGVATQRADRAPRPGSPVMTQVTNDLF